MSMPQINLRVLFWSEIWSASHGRKPKINELPVELQFLLGKKVFEYADYRDAHHPLLGDASLYEGCLLDHGIERNRPDGCDQDKRNWDGTYTLSYNANREELKIEEVKP